MIRVSSQQMYNTLLTGIQRQLQTQADGNASIASGKRFQGPLQAGLDYKTSLDLRHTQSTLKGTQDAITTAKAFMNISSNLLNSMKDIMTRAQTIAVQQSSGQVDAGSRAAAATEVQNLYNTAYTLANQRWQGQSVFAGSSVDKQAFVLDATGNAVYNGAPTDRLVAISPNESYVSNVRGDNPALTQMFTSLKSLQTALQTNNTAGLQAAVGSTSTAGSAIADLNGEMGGRIQSLDLRSQSLTDMQTVLEQRINTHESVDVAATVANLQQASVSLQASYSQLSRLQSLSIINYLK